MPLTPEFSISQDSDYLYFTIKCQNVRAKDMDMVVDGMDFNFSAEPYLLILHMHHGMRDGEGCYAKYDIETGLFEAKIRKAIPGEDFPEIYLLTTLKTPAAPKKPLIEVEDRTSTLEYIDEPPDTDKYGFNFQFSNFFENLDEIIPYVTDLPEPDLTPLDVRRQMRIDKENEEYDPDRVLNDYLFPFKTEPESVKEFYSEFTDDEKKRLLEIKRQEFLMSRKTAWSSFLSVAEVVFSSVVDIICFGPEGSCESNWTIAKLSATLSWFDAFDNAKDLILSSTRRTVAYCVARSFAVAQTAWRETVALFRQGRPPVLRALLRAILALEKAEHRWRLNRLYVEPMVAWLQELPEDDYGAFVADLARAVDAFVTKEELSRDWCVDLLEKYAEKLRREGGVPVLAESADIADSAAAADGAREEEEDILEHSYEPVDVNA